MLDKRILLNNCTKLVSIEMSQAHLRQMSRYLVPKLTGERSKAQTYENHRHRSLWAQAQKAGNATFEQRFDDEYPKYKHIFKRKLSRTWKKFPELNFKPKQFTFRKDWPIAQRRNPGERPPTARPYDAEAKVFIGRCDNNIGTMQRNHFNETAERFSKPALSQRLNMNVKKDSRVKQFSY